jgi:IS605 OrfB family transposase
MQGSEKTYFSNRIYKKDIESKINENISKLIYDFNKMKRFSYITLFKTEFKNYEIPDNKSNHMFVKEKYKYNDYFTNSAVQEAKAMLSGQKELHKMHKQGLEEALKKRKSKLKATKSELTKHCNILKLLLSKKLGSKLYLNNKLFVSKNNIYYYAVSKKETGVYYNAYDFEHQYLVPKIKSLKNKITMLGVGINSLNFKIESLKKMKSVCFGSRSFFKKQHTMLEYSENHDLWKSEFDTLRNNSMLISGRKDAKQGNFVFRYENNALIIILESGNIIIDNVKFPYGQDNVNTAISNQSVFRQAIAWRIEDHGEYYIFKVSFDINFSKLFSKNEKLPKKYSEELVNSYTDLNYSKSDGVIGYDLNYDHIAWAEINSRGQLIDYGKINFNIYKLTSNQVTNLIENAVIALINIAVDKKKPLCGEDLDLSKSKYKMQYDNKNCNRKISLFAYDKLHSAIINRAFKNDLYVFKINPAYTSMIGKVKYMKRFGISVHCSAAYVIARRCLRFKDTLPPGVFGSIPVGIATKHHWAHWGSIYGKLRKIPLKAFSSISFDKIDTSSFNAILSKYCEGHNFEHFSFS